MELIPEFCGERFLDAKKVFSVFFELLWPWPLSLYEWLLSLLFTTTPWELTLLPRRNLLPW